MNNSGKFAFVILLATTSALSSAFTLQVRIQPILVANTDGSNLSVETSYRNYASKIYAQADIELFFEPTRFLNDSSYNNFDDGNAWAMVNAPGKQQSSDPLTINAFFVNRTVSNSAYGFAFLNQPFAVMNTSLIQGFSALGRVDTFAHEICHNLGCGHTANGTPGLSKHLMAAGGSRSIPQSLTDVAPDGAGLDFLSASEIATMRSSRFARPIPEPATLIALGSGLAMFCRRRKQRGH